MDGIWKFESQFGERMDLCLEFQLGWNGRGMDWEWTQLVVRLGRGVDEVGEPPSQRLVLAAAAVTVAFLVGLGANPAFVRIRPVYPRVHRLLLPLRRRRLGVRRARGRNNDHGVRAPPAAAPVKERRQGARRRGCCHGECVCQSLWRGVLFEAAGD